MLEYYPDVMDPTTVREIIGVGKNKIYELLESGTINGFRVGKSWKISKEEVIRFIRDSSRQSPDRC